MSLKESEEISHSSLWIRKNLGELKNFFVYCERILGIFGVLFFIEFEKILGAPSACFERLRDNIGGTYVLWFL